MMTASGLPLRISSSADFTATVLRSKAFGSQRHAALLQRLLNTGKPGAPKTVILIENKRCGRYCGLS